VIVFKNQGQYFETIKSLSHYNKNELFKWSVSVGYITYNKKSEEALDKLDNASTASEYTALMENFQDFITIRKRKGESYIERTVEPNVYTKVANQDGLYIIGKTAYRILGDYCLNIKVEEIDKLLAVHYSDIKNNRVPYGINVKRYTYSVMSSNANEERTMKYVVDNIEILPVDSSWMNHKKTLSTSAQTSDRQVFLDVLCVDSPYGLAIVYQAYVKAYAYKRVWWFGYYWKPYKTEIHLTGTLENQDDFVVETPWGTKSYNIPHFVTTEDAYTLCPPAPYYGFGPERWEAYPGPEIYIKSAHLKAWTRGTTHNVYAEINYNLN